jgi:hypothetical protein
MENSPVVALLFDLRTLTAVQPNYAPIVSYALVCGAQKNAETTTRRRARSSTEQAQAVRHLPQETEAAVLRFHGLGRSPAH